MHRFRRTWMALMAGAFLVTLSVSAAFGAAPAPTRDATRGQTIAAFVHELVFGTDDDASDDEVVEEEELDENLNEESDELDEETEGDEESDAHGACVSAAAQDREASAESELKNHGKWVSQHARYICWGLDVPNDEPEETGDADEADASDEEEDEAELAESDDETKAAANPDRGHGKPSWAAAGNGGKGNGSGHGNGRGGGRR